MLTEQEQQRIRTEENYRLEVRRQLEADRWTHRKRVCRLLIALNAPIMIALVPSLAIVSLPIVFTSFQQWKTTQSEEINQINMIDVEINTRVRNALNEISRWHDWESANKHKVDTVLQTLDARSKVGRVLHVFADLKERTLIALLTTRQTLRPTSETHAASQSLEFIGTEFTRIKLNSKDEEINEVLAIVKKRLKSGFDYWLTLGDNGVK